MSYSDTGSIASALAGALLGQAGQAAPIGALAIADIFPAGGLYFYGTEADSDIADTFPDAPNGNPHNINIDAAVNAVVVDIQNVYSALKADPATPLATLNAHIAGQIASLAPSLAVIGNPLWLSYELIIFAMHLLMVQEQALTDPDHPGHPDASPFTSAAQQLALRYADHTNSIWSLDAGSVQSEIDRGNPDNLLPVATDDSVLGNVEAITALWQAFGTATAPFPPLARIVSATCTTTMTPLPHGSTEIGAWVSWSTISAAKVLLDQVSVSPSGSQQYLAQENEVGVLTGSIAPSTITATDQFGRSVSQAIAQA